MLTVKEFVELATDDVFLCAVYDLWEEKRIFTGELKNIPEELMEMTVQSWDTAEEGVICFNVDTSEE